MNGIVGKIKSKLEGIREKIENTSKNNISLELITNSEGDVELTDEKLSYYLEQAKTKLQSSATRLGTYEQSRVFLLGVYTLYLPLGFRFAPNLKGELHFYSVLAISLWSIIILYSLIAFAFSFRYKDSEEPGFSPSWYFSKRRFSKLLITQKFEELVDIESRISINENLLHDHQATFQKQVSLLLISFFILGTAHLFNGYRKGMYDTGVTILKNRKISYEVMIEICKNQYDIDRCIEAFQDYKDR